MNWDIWHRTDKKPRQQQVVWIYYDVSDLVMAALYINNGFKSTSADVVLPWPDCWCAIRKPIKPDFESGELDIESIERRVFDNIIELLDNLRDLYRIERSK